MKKQESLYGQFLNWHAARLGVYPSAVYAVLLFHPEFSIPEMATALAMSSRQVIRALKVLEIYNIIFVRRSVGMVNKYELSDPVGWHIKPLGPMPDFPDGALTCEWGHDFGEDGNAPQCRHCGLLQSEDTYKQMDGGPCPISPA